jgi:hypothetical protein
MSVRQSQLLEPTLGEYLKNGYQLRNGSNSDRSNILNNGVQGLFIVDMLKILEIGGWDLDRTA